MPVFACNVSATLEGIKEVTPTPGRSWMLKFTCTKCNTDTPNFIEVDPDEEVEVGGGTSNASFKCKECKNIISASIVPRSEGSFGEKGGTVVEIDVRGAEPIELLFDNRWSAVGAGESETAFEDVDLAEEFADYDEKEECPVTIADPVSTFARK